MKKYQRLWAILLVTLFLATAPLLAQSGFVPAQVKDISGRAYESAMIKLLDGAKKSIVISMYNISLGAKGRNPVSLLLNDLVEARSRNVDVTLYLNTKFRHAGNDPAQVINNPALKRLQNAGCVIHLMPYNRLLHD
ncbi:MAG: hypothetical protein HQ547_04140, partial [Candidatus Omnitrophica bacterium]|nr:hypothetical protein [Candidatus Omnitrophota bacterium]